MSLTDIAFRRQWGRKVGCITGGFPFILGMDDTPVYRDDTAALMEVVRPADIAQRLAPAVEQLAEQIVAQANGDLEVGDSLVLLVPIDVLGAYFRIPNPPDRDMRVS